MFLALLILISVVLIADQLQAYISIHKVQKPLCKDSEGLYDLYMIGLYNGLQIGLGIMTDKEPKLYKDEEENEDGISE